eukprot:c55777_g1_i1.p1 GENE.c55777_g1_i1~~c55777_g1_i1.p1  ORF type:complete len:127 (+),score=10.17 c55777_g1_i1:29-409(+)
MNFFVLILLMVAVVEVVGEEFHFTIKDCSGSLLYEKMIDDTTCNIIDFYNFQSLDIDYESDHIFQFFNDNECQTFCDYYRNSPDCQTYTSCFSYQENMITEMRSFHPKLIPSVFTLLNILLLIFSF